MVITLLLRATSAGYDKRLKLEEKGRTDPILFYCLKSLFIC